MSYLLMMDESSIIGFIISIFTAIIIVQMNQKDIAPYMDEIFHIPQAQRYCQLEFNYWDPKLTTFPGLYILSFILCKVFDLIKVLPNVCTNASGLRLHNTLFAICIWFMIYYCRNKIYLNDKKNSLIAWMLVTFPLNWFFYFLYYTDTASTLFILFTCYWSLNKSHSTLGHVIGFMVASLTILMRQTNVIWLLCYAGFRMLSIIQDDESSCLKERRYDLESLINQIQVFVIALWINRQKLIKQTFVLLLPIILFIIFVIWNGGITLGDKEHHKPVIHLAMPLHMLTVASLVTTLPDVIQLLINSNLHEIKNIIFKFHIYDMLGIVIVFIILICGMKDHPFLLSDNRHYMFYIWKRILSKSKFRFLLTPVYYYNAKYIILRLVKAHGFIWFIIYSLAVLITLLPVQLLEPRYFIPSITVLVIYFPFLEDSKMNTCSLYGIRLVIIVFILMNTILFHVFLNQSFQWHDGSIARFMI